MKTLKKSIALVLSLVMLLSLSACGKSDVIKKRKRAVYNKVTLSEYVNLGKYKGIEVNKSSDDFKEYYNELIASDIENNEFYNEITEGEVADGDIANINYVGKIDGVQFDGGTADNYDLTIGSNTFIDDFEEELIGVKVGETKDVTATFPTNYSNDPNLSGKEAIFTVTVNHIKKPKTPEEFYAELDFDSVEEYKEYTEETALENYLYDTVFENSEVKSYPEGSQAQFEQAVFDYYVEVYKAQGIDLEDYVGYYGYTLEDYRTDILNVQVVPTFMKAAMVSFCIMDVEGLELKVTDVEKQKINQIEIAQTYAAQEVVVDFIIQNAKITGKVESASVNIDTQIK